MVVVKAVLLDLDDTVYAYRICKDYAMKACLAKISKKYGIEKSEAKRYFSYAREMVKKNAGNTGASHSRLLYFKNLTEAIEGRTNGSFSLALDELFWKKYLPKMKLRDGAMDFIKACRKSKVKVCIVTNLTTQIQLEKLKKLGIADFVDFVVTSEEAGAEKPNLKIMELALEKTGVKKNHVIFAGDEDDSEAARAFGINFFDAKKHGFSDIIEKIKKNESGEKH